MLFLASPDQTIVSTALSNIVAELGGVDHLSRGLTAYLLSSTVVAPMYGKLGDLYGRRMMMQVSVVIFLAGRCRGWAAAGFLWINRAGAGCFM